MKKSEGQWLLDKVLSQKTTLKNVASRIAYSVHDYGIQDLPGETIFIISQEIKKNKKTVINSPAYKALIKKAGILAEKDLVSFIHEAAGYHETVVKNQKEKLKTNVAMETFLQVAAKKLNKKELAQLQKLLPISDNLITNDPDV